MENRPNLPIQSLSQFVIALSVTLDQLQKRVDALFPADGALEMAGGDINDAGTITAGQLRLNNRVSVANPPLGKVAYWTDGVDLFATNSAGTTKTFLTASGNVVQSDGAPSVAGNIPEYVDATGELITDSGRSLGEFLPRDGSAVMTGALDMDGNNITNVGTLSGPTYSRTADNIVSNAGASVDTHIAIFSGATGKVITDSGATLSQYALLSGATFTGAIAMGGNNITNVGTLSGPTNSRTADNIVSNAGASVNARIAIFSGVTGKVITDSGSTLSQYALLSGATFTGAIAMGGNNITNVGTLSGPTNSRTADNIVSNAGASVNARIAIFSGVTGKVITDGGTTLSEYLLLNGSAAMTGDLNLNGSGIVTGGNAVRFGSGAAAGTTSSVAIGNGASAALTNSAAFGSGANASGFASLAMGVSAVSSGTESVAVGNSASASDTGAVGLGNSAQAFGFRAIAIGRTAAAAGAESAAIGSGASATGTNSFAAGTGASASNTNAISIGSSTSSSGQGSIALGGVASADGAIAIGGGATNATADSCLIGTAAVANIRPNSIVCDLGTTAAPFKVCFLKDSTVASASKFVMHDSVTYGNTTGETSLTTGASVGSLVFPATQSLGMSIITVSTFTISVNGGNSLTLRFKVGATTMITHTVSGALAAVPMTVETWWAIGNFGSITVTSRLVINNTHDMVQGVSLGYDRSVSNTFDLTGEYTVADPGNTVTHLTMMVQSIYAQ